MPATLGELLGSELTPALMHEAAELATGLGDGEIIDLVERLPSARGALLFRILPKGRALVVFESLDAGHQADLITALREADVVEVFEAMDPTTG